MLGRQPGSLEAQKGESPWDLRGLEFRKKPATVGQACFWWWMGCVSCKWITKPNHQENKLLYGDASYLQPTATSATLGASLSAQIIPHTIKLQPLPAYKGEIDYKIIEAWIYSVNNYFTLTGSTDPNQQAHFAATLIQNAAALWLCTSGVDLKAVYWPRLKTRICYCFRPAGFLRHAPNELATIKQTGYVTGYIDTFKCICSKITSISDDKILDYFIRGLQTET